MEGRKEIWTVGHSTWSSEDFVNLLKSFNIQAIADVRRYPGSRRNPQFMQSVLEASLSAAGIYYLHLPELGGRRKPLRDSPNDIWRHEAFRGYADYMQTPAFHKGVKKLRELARSKASAVMCAELLWWRCHRRLLADLFKLEGYHVWHIMGTRKTSEHPLTAGARLIEGSICYKAEAIFPG